MLKHIRNTDALIMLKVLKKFHTVSRLRGSNIKTKLTQFEKNETITQQTEKELKKELINQKVKLRKIQKKAYTKSQALNILKKKYEIDDTNLNIGPTSDLDSKFLMLSKDKRLLYTILGINGEQLRDSKLVSNDVLKFCKRNQMDKAIFLIRLAKLNGIVGMNKLMEHYCETLNDVDSGLSLYSWRKKWGIPPNEYTETILFRGLSKSPNGLSTKQCQKVVKIVSSLIEKKKLNEISFNAAINALANSKYPNFVFECFDLKPKNIPVDSITYTQLLSACGNIKNNELSIQNANEIMSKVPKKYIDSQLIFHYINIWNMRNDFKLSNCTMALISIFYDIDFPKSIVYPDDIQLPQLSYWNIENRFPLTPQIINLIIESCIKTKKWELGEIMWEKFTKESSSKLDFKNFYTMMELNIKGFPTTCAWRNINLYKSIDTNDKLKRNISSLLMVYKSFERQCGKKFINDDVSKLEETLNKCHEFILNEDFQRDCNGEKIIKWKAWMYYWNIISSADQKNNILYARKKMILDSFIDTLLANKITTELKNNLETQSMRHILIEAIRFLNKFNQKLVLKDVDISSLQDGSPQKDQFLFKRLIMRFKVKISSILSSLETNTLDTLEFESTSQIAQRIRKIKISKNT